MARRVYADFDVYEAARRRIHWSYDNCDRVVCSWSGGKDSTVAMGIALEVARERGELPLTVYWMDCEAEWMSVANMAERVRANPDIDFRWYQLPLQLFDASGIQEIAFMNAWDPEAQSEWMRPRAYGAITENVYGKDRFMDLVAAVPEKDFTNDGTESVAMLSGIRANESATRSQSVWGSYHMLHCLLETFGVPVPEYLPSNKGAVYPISPIIDWNHTDVWKAIHAKGWEYCEIYDKMYQAGIPVREMRVSSLIHVNSLLSRTTKILAELEPETWEALVRRAPSMNDIKHLRRDDSYAVRNLPPAYRTWKEYRDDLLQRLHMSADDEKKEHRYQHMKRVFDRQEKLLDEAPEYIADDVRISMYRHQIGIITTSDTQSGQSAQFMSGLKSRIERAKKKAAS